MPAVSKAQRTAMAIAEQVKKGKMKAEPGSPSAEMAKSMSKSQLHDFASTKEAGLPESKGSKSSGGMKVRTMSHKINRYKL